MNASANQLLLASKISFKMQFNTQIKATIKFNVLFFLIPPKLQRGLDIVGVRTFVYNYAL